MHKSICIKLLLLDQAALHDLPHSLRSRYANDQHSRGGCWLAFFLLQGVVVGVEGVGKRILKQNGIKVPHWLAAVITLSLQMSLAHVLFFPGVTNAKIDAKSYVLQRWHSLCSVLV